MADNLPEDELPDDSHPAFGFGLDFDPEELAAWKEIAGTGPAIEEPEPRTIGAGKLDVTGEKVQQGDLPVLTGTTIRTEAPFPVITKP